MEYKKYMDTYFPSKNLLYEDEQTSMQSIWTLSIFSKLIMFEIKHTYL